MTLDDLLDGLAAHDPVPLAAMAAALERWDEVVPHFRALLRGYVDGADLSERTERALYPITHLLGERADTASFPDLCRLAGSGDRLHSVLGPDAICLSCPAILVGTFDGDAAPLFRLAEATGAEDAVRCDAVLAVAFLAGQGRIADKQAYAFLAALPAKLDGGRASDVWWGFAQAVATLGFPGLSAAVEAAIDGGCIPAPAYPKAEFWRQLRDAQANGRDYADADWQRFEPLGSAADHLAFLAETDGAEGDGFDENGPFDAALAAEPVRNPLRSVGRNDPCPCGSGKKYKKCCLQAGAD